MAAAFVSLWRSDRLSYTHVRGQLFLDFSHESERAVLLIICVVSLGACHKAESQKIAESAYHDGYHNHSTCGQTRLACLDTDESDECCRKYAEKHALVLHKAGRLGVDLFNAFLQVLPVSLRYGVADVRCPTYYP